MTRNYRTITKIGPANAGRLAEFLSRNGQVLLPMVDLIEQSRLAIDELIDVAGRATIEAVLQLSAEQVAGPRTPGKQREEVVWHGPATRVGEPEGTLVPRKRAQGWIVSIADKKKLDKGEGGYQPVKLPVRLRGQQHD